MVTERCQLVLKVLIEAYLATGAPVGSKTLAEKGCLGLSSASIRNVMAELEDSGMIVSPHRSAGRVPTAAGLQYFLDNLLLIDTLTQTTVRHIEQQLNTEHSHQTLIQTIPSILSTLSNWVGVVTVPKYQQMVLRHIEFVPITAKKVLVILVLNGYDIQNIMLQLDVPFSTASLQQASNYINHHFSGLGLEVIRQKLYHSMQSDKHQFDEVMQTVLTMAKASLTPLTEQEKNTVMVSDEEGLFSCVRHQSMDELHHLLTAFSQKQQILTLLDECLKGDGVQIFIGEGSGQEALTQCSLVTANYYYEGQAIGALGVIGPMRMRYEQVVPVVEATAKLLSSALNSNETYP